MTGTFEGGDIRVRRGHILVVGGLPRDWAELWRDPKVIFWSDQDGERKSDIPGSVFQVYFAKYLSHPIVERVKKMAKRQGIAFSVQLMEIGQIKNLILAYRRPIKPAPATVPITTAVLPARLVAAIPKEVRMTPATASATKHGKDKYTKLGLQQLWKFAATLDNAALSCQASAKAILGKVHETGYKDATLGGLAQAIRKARQAAGVVTAKPAKKTTRKSVRQRKRVLKQEAAQKDSAVFLAENIELIATATLEVLEENKRLRAENRRLDGLLRKWRKAVGKLKLD